MESFGGNPIEGAILGSAGSYAIYLVRFQIGADISMDANVDRNARVGSLMRGCKTVGKAPPAP